MTEDKDPIETREWLDALDEVVRYEGEERASFLLLELAKHAMKSRLRLPSASVTDFARLSHTGPTSSTRSESWRAESRTTSTTR